jgi:hypothetical protein
VGEPGARSQESGGIQNPESRIQEEFRRQEPGGIQEAVFRRKRGRGQIM